MSRVFALLLALTTIAAAPCETCEIVGGRYHTVTPPGWDGHTALPILMFLHGYQGSGGDVVQDPAVMGPAAKLGFLLVAPDGLNRTWAHVGSPSRARDDRGFLRAVLEDARGRWPVDGAHIVASGFSQGASMVWDLACYDAPEFSAFLPFSGGFWEPMPEGCHAGPVALRQVHGTADTTMPLAGRALFGPYRQGDVRAGFSRFLAEDGCRAEPDLRAREDDLDCATWSSCTRGRLQFCLHDGEHMFRGDWVESGLRWALAQP